MANTNKRVDEGIKAVQKSVYTAMQFIPEVANNPDRTEEIAVKYLKEVWLPLTRAGLRLEEESYQDYLDRKANAKNTGREIAKTLGEQFGLSKKSTEIMYGIVAGAAKVAFEGEAEIPPQTVTFTGGDVTVGGSINPKKDEYRVTGDVNLDLDPFGLKEGYLTAGATASSTSEGVSIDRARIGAEAPFLGGTLSGEVSGNPYEQQARVNYTLPFKKGGKVKKKTKKTKKYTKGCVVRAAKY